MSSWIDAGQGYHDIDTDLDSATLARLPHGLMQHHAFQPHLWRTGDRVAVATADGGRHAGEAVDVSMSTGNMLIRLNPGPSDHGQESMPDARMVS